MGLKDENLRRIRATKVVNMRVSGHRLGQIAEELNISIDTVERDIKYAEKANLFLDLEQKLLHQLAPKAITAIETALEDGDAETAIEVLKSLGIMKDSKAPKTQVEANQSDDLARAIEEARERRQLNAETADGELIPTGGRSGLAGLLEPINETAEETVCETATVTVGDVVEPAPQVETGDSETR